ncbi:histidine kinase/DNA gyrase B/HSP90-like ATPase [Methylobacter tundripaludum]|uniref:Histidine kinase/DNA gyrase B/HSP90-like ATPase n=1 Tax=Methylobacter tundripaludum TaxID=173365 RepID=A0A2S6HB96_9GAMM|nr:ATP-binding protein [Methylobacter tundripaludum]PPK74759.1 histidine kinase/DNA gyrase B/HSP90-like ATPase [Methylobacter tundripaludum]
MDINVSPDMQFYTLLESYPYTSTGALCEYIDNALEAFKSAKNKSFENLPDKLEIDIALTHNSIVIRDYGVGISINDIQRAMKPAYTPGKQSLSEFGIGMKAASMWFGRSWKLESFPLNEANSFSLSFNLDDLLINQTEVVKLKKKKQSEPNKSGVKITLAELNKSLDKIQAERIWKKIEEIYQLFTSRDDPILILILKYDGIAFQKKNFSELKITSKPLEFPLCKFKDSVLYVIGSSQVWKKDISFEFEGKIVKGFISLGEESSQTKNPGIRLFRYGRLIKGSEAEPYRPTQLLGSANKAAPSRFYAELHLDGQAVSNSKGEFVFDEHLFIDTIEEQEGVKDFIIQAENYRQRKVDDNNYKKVSTVAEYEKLTGTKLNETKEEKKTKKPSKVRKPNNKEQPIAIIQKLSAPPSFLLLDTFLEESVRLYNDKRFWPFCLVYRTILEVGIIEKLKKTHEEHYIKAKDKSIVALYKYLQSNSNIIPSYYETLKRVLRVANNNDEPFVGLLNIASHGRYVPTQSDVDDLLKNTQQLLEWAFDREGD